MALIDGGLAETPARFLVAAAAPRYGQGEGRLSVLAFGSQWTSQSCQSEPNPVHARSYSPPYESTMALLFVIYKDLGILVWGATYAAQTSTRRGLGQYSYTGNTNDDDPNGRGPYFPSGNRFCSS